MKNIIKITGLLILFAFSFFYTDKAVSVISEKDSLMIELKKVKDSYKVESIDGIVKDNTIIPGIYGKEINIEKSYKKMKELGAFNNKLIIYDSIKPKNSIADNKNKYIVKGNDSKQMVSIIFILDDDKYYTRLENIATNKNIIINYFVTYDYLIENSTKVAGMKNREVYNYGVDGEYSPDNIIFANNLISRITKNNALYCLTTSKNKKVLDICSSNSLYTILPSMYIKSNPYSEIKDRLTSGSIILMDMNNSNITELGIVVDYIRGKGLVIDRLSNLLDERL